MSTMSSGRWPWPFPLLVVLSAFFSGSETALTAASRARMLALEKSGDKRAGIVGRLIQDRERLIGALLLGNNLVNILASALATSLFLALFGQAGVVYATLAMTLLVLVFGEVLPKTLAIGDPDRVSRTIAPMISVIVAVFSPVVIAVQFVVAGVLRLAGWNASDGKSILSPAEEIRGQVDLFHAEGSVVKAERDRLGGLLDLSELDVSDVMVHRTGMHTIDADEPIGAIVDDILACPFTRVPLWEGEPENIIGIVHVKDLLRALKAADGKVEGDRHPLDRRQAVVRARHHQRARPAQRLPQAQGAFRAGRRRVWRGAGRRDAGGYPRGDRRRHRRRARRCRRGRAPAA